MDMRCCETSSLGPNEERGAGDLGGECPYGELGDQAGTFGKGTISRVEILAAEIAAASPVSAV